MDGPFHHYLVRDYILVKLNTDTCMSLPVFQRASGQSQNCVMTSKKDQKQWYGDIRPSRMSPISDVAARRAECGERSQDAWTIGWGLHTWR